MSRSERLTFAFVLIVPAALGLLLALVAIAANRRRPGAAAGLAIAGASLAAAPLLLFGALGLG